MPREATFLDEEFVRRGKELYQAILPRVEAGHHGHYVVIDVETGDYEVAEKDDVAWRRLRARRPETQVWMERIGCPASMKLRMDVKPAGTVTLEPLP
jgi:hypothetical protein